MAGAQYAQADTVYLGKDQVIFPNWESTTTQTPEQTAQLTQSIDLIKDVGQELKKQNIDLVVTIVPTRARFLKEYLPDDQKFSPAIESRYNQITQEFDKRNIKNIPMLDALQEASKKGMTIFYKTDQHWLPEVSEYTANFVASKLAPMVAPDPKYIPFQKTPNPEKRAGDMVGLVSGDKGKSLANETYNVSLWKKSTQPALEETKLAVVGNSFTNPYLGFPQSLANALKTDVDLHWNYGDVGPWKNMLLYLQSDNFKDNKPKVILWEMNESNLLHSPDSPSIWKQGSSLPVDQFKAQVQAALK